MIRSESNNTSSSESARASADRQTRRVLNLPLLVGTLVAVVVMGPAAYCWHSYQLRRTSGVLLEEADRLERAEEFIKAAGYLDRYLRLYPNNVAVRIRLAETFDKSAEDFNSKWRAKNLYYRALGVAPADRQRDLRCRLAELLLELGKDFGYSTTFSLAETEANKLLKANAGDPRAKRLLALARDGQHRSGLLAGESEAGTHIVTALETALLKNGGDIQLSDALAQLYRDPQRLPDHEFSAILHKVCQRQNGSPEDAFSAIRARIARADKQPLGDKLSGMIAQRQPEGLRDPGPQDSAGPVTTLVITHFGGSAAGTSGKRAGIAVAVRGLLADDAIDEMVKANPKDPKAYLTRYRYDRAHGLRRGDEDWAAILDLERDNLDVLVAAATHSREQAARAQAEGLAPEVVREHLESAQNYYQRLLRIVNVQTESPHAYLGACVGLGDVFSAQDQPEEAIKTWQTALDNLGDQQLNLDPRLLGDMTNLSLRLADALTKQGRLNEAWVPNAHPDNPGELARAEKAPMNRLDAAFNRLGHGLQPSLKLAIDRAIRLAQAQWFVNNGEYAEAIPLLKEIATGQHRTPQEIMRGYQACISLGTSHAALGQWDQVARAWEQAASLRPDIPQTRVQAAEAWARSGRHDLAIQQYELALAVADEPEIHYQLAKTLFVRQVGLPAEKRDWSLLENALDELKKPAFTDRLDQAWRVNLLQADYLRARDQEEAPRDGAKGERSPAIKTAKNLLDEALGDYPDSPNLFRALVTTYERMEYPEDADRALAKLLELTPESATCYLLGSYVLCGREQYDEARKLVQEGIEKVPAESRALLQIRLPQISVGEGDLQRACDEALSLHNADPSNVGFMWFLADLALQMNQASDLKGWEDKLYQAENSKKEKKEKEKEKEEPDGVFWRYCRARRLLGESSQAWRDAAASGKRAEMEKARTDMVKVLGDAGALCNEIQKRRPTWGRVHELRGRLFQQQAGLDPAPQSRQLKYQNAIDAYQKAIALGADQVAVYERLIPLLTRLQRFQEADRYLARLKARGSSSENLLQYEISAAGRQGGLAEAIKTARRGVESRPDDADAQIWYGQVLAYDGQQEAAETALKKAIELAPADARTYGALFAFYLRTQQREQAVNTLQELARKGQMAPLQLALVLAQSYEQLGDLRAAEARYREAGKLAEAADASLVVAVKLRLAALLSRTDLAAAETVLRESRKLAPESDAARRGLVDLLTQRALALPAGESEAVWREIQQLLDQAGSDAAVSSSNQRLQAALLLQRGGEENLQKARRLFEKLVEQSKGDADIDRLSLALVYAAQSELYSADAESYKKSNAQENPAGTDRKLKKSYEEYLALFRKSREEFLTLVAREKPNPIYLESYVDLLLRHKELLPNEFSNEAMQWRRKLATIVTQNRENTQLVDRYFALLRRHDLLDEADRWLTGLEKTSPDSFHLLGLRVAWLHGLDRTSEIQPLVERFAEKRLSELPQSGDERTQKEASICANVGRLYALVQQDEPAERWYRRLVELTPENYAPLAMTLTRQGRAADAIRLCVDAAQSDSSSRPAIVAAGVLAATDPTPENSQLAEPLLSRALADFSREGDLLAAVANARVRQGHVDEAIRLYRRIVDLEPKNAVALNNLATLLSEQPGGAEEALDFVERAIRVAGPTPQLLDTKGTILIYNGKIAQAIPVLKKAASSLQADPRFPFHLAVAYYRNDKTDKANKAKEMLVRALDGNLEKQLLTEKDREFLAEMKKTLR